MNDSCPCGSGLKFANCCGSIEGSPIVGLTPPRRYSLPEDQLCHEIIASINSKIFINGNSKINGPEAVKNALNKCYKDASYRLEKLLNSRDWSAWVLEAYRQLCLWSLIFHEGRGDITKREEVKAFHISIAPAARYGWRFIIERCIARQKEKQLIYRGSPNEDDLSQALTCLTVMYLASEFSNWIHFFSQEMKTVSIDLKDENTLLWPRLDAREDGNFQDRLLYLAAHLPSGVRDDIELSIDHQLGCYANEVLLKYFGFDLTDCTYLASILAEKISGPIILVHSYRYIQSWVKSLVKDRNVARVLRALDYCLFGNDFSEISNRDFLQRSEPNRMLNFAGLLLGDVKFLDSIYAVSDITSEISGAEKHIILSAPMMGEWIDTIWLRLYSGLNIHIPKEPEAKIKTKQISQKYQKEIFEPYVSQYFERKGYYCIQNLKKVIIKGKACPIPCGEIDLLAYSSASNTLCCVESKSYAGAVSSKGHRQIFNDHFKQKMYHEKFIKKMQWVSDSMGYLSGLFASKHGITMPANCKFSALFVTKYPSIIKYFVTEYRCINIGELESLLTETPNG